MPFVDNGFDIKLTLGATSKQYRLLQQQGRKAWTVSEQPAVPRMGADSLVQEGLNPLTDLNFRQADWVWGVGMERLGPNPERPGHLHRYAEGKNIDTTNPGIVLHGPAEIGGAALTTLDAPALKMIMFSNSVWFMTTSSLYEWDGSTVNQRWVPGGGELLLDMEVHGTNLIIATDVGSGTYYHTDGASFPPTSKTLTGATNITKLLTLQGLTSPIIHFAHDTNKITPSSDPITPATPGTTITVGPGENITNMFAISGLLFVATESTIYTVDADDQIIEMDKTLQTQRSATAFSVSSDTGSEVWLASGTDIDALRVVGVTLDSFDFRPDGPAFSTDQLPINAAFMDGDIEAIAHGFDALYISKEVPNDGDNIIFKGREIVRGQLVWTPFIRYAGPTSSMGIFRLSGDSRPVIYVGSGSDIFAYDSREYGIFNPAWELVTPFLTGRSEHVDKFIHSINVLVDRTGTFSKIIVSYRTDPDAAWTVFGSTGEITTDGHSEIVLTTPIVAKQIQLRFAGSTTSTTSKIDLRGYTLEGFVHPELKRTFQFTVIADNKDQADFIYSLRTDTTNFISIVDRFGTTHTAFILPGFPVEQEIVDESKRNPVRVYQIVAQAVNAG